MIFRKKRRRSKDFARDRLKTILLSERIDCSSQTMIMMKNDLIQAAGKYLPVDRERVTFRYAADKRLIEVRFPLKECTMECTMEGEDRQ